MRIFQILAVFVCTQLAVAYQWGSVANGGGGFVSSVVAHPGEQNLIYARTDVGGAYKWVESSQSWKPLLDWLGDGQTSYYGVEAIALDPQNPAKLYMFAGTSYWNSGISAILRSSDYGATFTVSTVSFSANGNGPGRGTGEKLAVDPNNGNILFCGTRTSGLYKSTDAGATWTKLSNFPITATDNGVGISFVVFDKASGTTGSATPNIYVGVSRLGSSNIYRSTDGGASWSAVSGQNTTYMPQRAVLSSDRKLYITYANGASPNGVKADYTYDAMNAGALWVYNISAATWTNKSPTYSSVTPPLSGVSVSASNANTLVVTSVNTYKQQAWGWGDLVWTSTDGGTTWTNLMEYGKATMNANGMPWIVNHALHWAAGAVIDPFNANRVFVTSGNGIFMTPARNSSTPAWNFVAKGIEEVVVNEAVSVPGGPVVTAIWDYDGFRNYAPTTYALSQLGPNLSYVQGLAVAALKPQYMARSGSALQTSIDTGLTWTVLAGPSGYTNGRLALSADGNSLLWGNGTTMYRNRRNGTGNSWNGWSAVSITGFSSPRPIADPVNSAKFYAYDRTTGNLYVSSDSGKTFNIGTSPGSWAHDRLAVAPGNEGDIWIASFNNKIIRLKGTTATSMTKSIISTVDYCEAISLGKAATTGGYPAIYMYGKVNSISSNIGMYRSIDQGATWTRINDDAHQYGGLANGGFVQADWNVFGRVYRSTAGQGLVYGEDNSSSSVASSSSTITSSSSIASSSSAVVSSSSTTTSSSSVVASSSSTAASSSSASTTSACIAFVNGVGGYLNNCYKSGLANMAANTCYTQNPSTSAVTWINGDASVTYWWSVTACAAVTSSSSIASSSSVAAASSSSTVVSSSSSATVASSSSVVSSSSLVSSSSAVVASSSSALVSSSSIASSSSMTTSSSSTGSTTGTTLKSCIAFVNGVGNYASNCYSSGLTNMASGSCYTLNSARGTSPTWITPTASDSWWWSTTSCAGMKIKSALQIASGAQITHYSVYNLQGKPVLTSSVYPQALPVGRWIVVAQDRYGNIVQRWVKNQP